MHIIMPHVLLQSTHVGTEILEQLQPKENFRWL